MSNKGKEKEDNLLKTNSAVKKEKPIEDIPTAEVKEDTQQISEKRQEKKNLQKVKQQQAKVILITRDGCIGEKIGEPGNNISFYGDSFMSKQIGDIIEF